MSSLAASRADGYYFPPEYLDNEVNKKMGLSKYQGSKGANQYQQRGVIRFELPFDAWCLKCERHISKGTRFNAKKDKCGMYFSTTIFSFTMKCPSCDNHMVIKTDPENRTYDYAEGLRKHEQDFNPEEGDGIIETTTEETKKKLQSDPMFKLQHDKEDKERAITAKARISSLVETSEKIYRADYDLNSSLRSANRSHRKRQSELKLEGEQKGLSIPLVEPSPDDEVNAKKAKFRCIDGSNGGFAKSKRIRAAEILTQGIFESKRGTKHYDKVSNPSSSFKKNSNMKNAIKKQAHYKINMKHVKLSSDPNDALSSDSKCFPIAKQGHTHLSLPRPNKMENNGCEGALSLLGDYCESD